MSNDLSHALQTQVKEALANKQTLAIIGGQSKKFLQTPVATSTLELVNHSGVIDYQPSELFITARAGTPLSEIERLLTEHQQLLASESPHFSHGENLATLGGTIACGYSGSRRPFSGSLRDHVLGVRILNGEGELLTFGGQVMKNVAGFDVSRLMVGARGTLGALLEITLRVMPKPEAEITLRFECSLRHSAQRMVDFMHQSLPLSAMAWLEGAVFIRLQGTERVIQNAKQKVGGELMTNSPHFWQSLGEQTHPFFHAQSPLWRLSMPPSSHLEIPEQALFVDWCGGLRWWHTDKSEDEVKKMAAKQGGYAYLFRDAVPVSGDVPPAHLLALHQRLKKSFDPQCIFNPGVMGDSV